MPRGKGRRWPSRLGYLLYTLLMVGLALWLLFPHERVQRLVTGYANRLTPQLQWHVAKIGLRLPLVLVMEQVEATSPAYPGQIILRFDDLEIRPDLLKSLHQRALWLEYRMRMAAATAEGQCGRQGGQWLLNGRLRALELAAIPTLGDWLGRKVQGRVSLTYEGNGRLQPVPVLHWKAQVTVESGRLLLQRPVLSHAEIPFSQVSALLHGEGGRISIDEGNLDSPLGKGWFKGNVSLMATTEQQLDLRGAMQPEEQFFAGVANTVALQALRAELRDKPLSVQISGGLQHPGIHFGDVAMQMYALEKESR